MSRAATGRALRPVEFVPLIALLMSLVALAIDAMLPALPAIGRDLGRRARTTSSSSLRPCSWGSGSARFSSALSPTASGASPPSMPPRPVHGREPRIRLRIHVRGDDRGRVLQGIGVAGPRIVTVALVRDQYEGRRMARLMSFAMAVFILVPTVAPALGQGIMWLGGWRAIFTTFFAIAAVAFAWFALRQPETLPADRRRPFSPRVVGRAVLEILRIRAALGYTVATGFVFAPFIAYLSSAQQIFQEAYQTGALFPAYFGVLALAIGGASLVNGRLVMEHGMRRLSKVAAVSITAISLVAWAGVFAFDGLPPLWLFMAYLMIVFVCIGLLFGNLNALAMEPLGHIAGVGAAVVASLSTFISVPLGALVGQSFDGTMYAQIGAFAVFGAGTFAAMWWAEGGGGARVISRWPDCRSD